MGSRHPLQRMQVSPANSRQDLPRNCHPSQHHLLSPSPLEWLEAVKMLLAKGANVNAVSKTEGLPRIQTGIVEFGGWTPLLMAVPFGPPDIAQTLIDAGAKVKHAEAFEICEYGRRPDKNELKRLFPFYQ